jgi:catechol 2,3-dioxygenase-like lactoylglutathione lyase family enzyme
MKPAESEAIPEYKRIITSKGSAVGRITGVNHIQLVVLEMEASVLFYRDLLGFRVIRTLGADYMPVGTTNMPSWPVPHDYFFELPDGTLLTLIEVSGASRAQHSIWTPSFWPGEHMVPKSPEKLDHLAFNVPSRTDLVWFRDHLRANGIQTSEVHIRREPPRFVDSLYFKDPSGIPLELASWDRSDPSWEGQKPEDWFVDKDPVPALLR